MALVERYQDQMLRIARMYVHSQAIAEEVVQEAWLGVLNGIDAFEGRASLRTWIFRILVNIAKTRGQRERRSIPFSSLWPTEGDEPALEPERFLGEGQRWAGHWADAPSSWETVPEARLLSTEILEQVGAAI